MSAIRFEDVTKEFSNMARLAVDHCSLTVDKGQFVILLGPSGCGKTTLLKMVNRLYEPSSGTIYLNGVDIRQMDTTTVRRQIGYVIQQVGLFPHMTVAQNISIVPNLLRWPKPRIQERVDELLALVALPPAEYRARYPAQLSGGQQQRIGVARALAGDPEFILMDEPFGAVDAITRASLQNELLALQQKLHKTILFVTHDVDEALRLGNKLVIMRDGKIVQYDTPFNLLNHPADAFVKELMGGDDLVRQLGLVCVETAMQQLPPQFHLDGQPTIGCDKDLRHALSLLLQADTPAVIVTDGQTPIGLLTLDDIARFNRKNRELMDYVVHNPTIVLQLTEQHLFMVASALLIAILIALPLSLLLLRVPRVATVILGLLGILYSIPSIALLILLLPFFGLNSNSVIVALVIYTQIILVRNMVTGLQGVPAPMLEAAKGMGMTAWQRWWQVQFPLALPVILAGVRIATVVAIGIATIGAKFGAGGLGTLLFDGIAQNRYDKIVVGSVIVALLALILNRLLLALEHYFDPTHRIKRAEKRQFSKYVPLGAPSG